MANEVPTAVLFDWGGVLIDDPLASIISYCAKVLSVSPETYKAIHLQLGPLLDTGKLSECDYWEKVCSALQVEQPPQSSLWGEAFAASYIPRKEMFALAHTLRSRGMSVGLLSNTEPAGQRYFESQPYDQFQVRVYSCAVGVRKPDPAIYMLALERIGAAAADTVFIDDRKENIAAADRLGMRTVLCADPQLAIADIRRLVG